MNYLIFCKYTHNWCDTSFNVSCDFLSLHSDPRLIKAEIRVLPHPQRSVMYFHVKEGIQFCVLTNLNMSWRQCADRGWFPIITVLISHEEESFIWRKSWWFIPKKPIIVSHETSLERAPGRVPSLFITYQIATL